MRPCLGRIHQREIAGYRFFGYGDIEAIYGKIGRFYTDEVLADSNIISALPERLSGHFLVLRNTEAIRRAYERIPNYRDLLEEPRNMNMDEGSFTKVFRSSESDLRSLRRILARSIRVGAGRCLLSASVRY